MHASLKFLKNVKVAALVGSICRHTAAHTRFKKNINIHNYEDGHMYNNMSRLSESYCCLAAT